MTDRARIALPGVTGHHGFELGARLAVDQPLVLVVDDHERSKLTSDTVEWFSFKIVVFESLFFAIGSLAGRPMRRSIREGGFASKLAPTRETARRRHHATGQTTSFHGSLTADSRPRSLLPRDRHDPKDATTRLHPLLASVECDGADVAGHRQVSNAMETEDGTWSGFVQSGLHHHS